MYLGKVVEEGPTEQVLRNPQHPYTQALLAAVPRPNPADRPDRKNYLVKGDLPDPTSPPTGCAFQTRCPLVIDECRTSPDRKRTRLNSSHSCATRMQSSA